MGRMKLTTLAALVIATLAACGPPLQTCASLGWQCGTDDLGHVCGDCPANDVCTDGVCIQGCVPQCEDVCALDGCGGFCTGPCPAVGAVCQRGACVVPPCDTMAYFGCTSASRCCPVPAFSPGAGTPTSCSTIEGLSDCDAVCTSDAECDYLTDTTGTWHCTTRTDGVRVCVP